MSIGKNSVISLATDLVVFGLGILLSVVLTTKLGQEGRGIYTLLVTTNSLLAISLSLSVGSACTIFLAQGRYRVADVQTIVAGLALLLGALAGLGATLAYAALRDSLFRTVPYTDLLVALVLVPPAIYQTYWNAIMVGTNRIAEMNGLNLAFNFGNTALLLVTVGVLGWGVAGFLLAWTLSWLGWLLGSVLLSQRRGGFAWPPRRTVARDLLGFGLRGHGGQIANQLFLNFDVYVVQSTRGLGSLGVYSLAVSLAKKLWLPLNAVGAAATNRINGLPGAESVALTAKVTRTSVLIVTALALPLALVSPWLIPFVYGADFAGAVVPLIILLGGAAAFAVSQVLTIYITGQMGRPGLLSILSWLELGVSIPLYLGLIWACGIVGAALASTLTYVLAMIGTLYLFRRYTGAAWRDLLLPQAQDWADYRRVLRGVWDRLAAMRRTAL